MVAVNYEPIYIKDNSVDIKLKYIMYLLPGTASTMSIPEKWVYYASIKDEKTSILEHHLNEKSISVGGSKVTRQCLITII